MRTLVFILISMSIAACQSGGSSNITSKAEPVPSSPSPSPPPTPSPSPSPTPTPTPTCITQVEGTHWVNDGLPALTSFSTDQTGQPAIVQDLDLTQVNPNFDESMYEAGSGVYLTCQRTWADANLQGGDSYSRVWLTGVGAHCGSVVTWFQFSITGCTEMTAVLRDGGGNVYETQLYKPL